MALSEKVQQLNREIGSTFERAVADMRQEVSQWLRSSSEDLLGRLAELRPPVPESFVAHDDLEPSVRSEAEGLAEGLASGARRGGLSELREALGAIDRARSQAEILTALMQESARYASRSAILLLRGGEVRGWSGHGFGDADSAVRDLNLGAPGDGSWSHAFQGQGPARLSANECAALCSRLETPVPRDGVLVPLVLRDRVAAALYADRTDGAPFTPEALQVLCYTAALAIESLPFRERSSTATLAPVEEAVEEEAAAIEAPPEEPPAVDAGAQTAAIPAYTGEVAQDETEPTQPWTPAQPMTETMEEPAEALPAAAGWESPAGTTSDVEVEMEVMAEPEPEPAAPWAEVEESETYELESIDDTAAEPASGWGEPADDEDAATPTQKVDLRGLSAVIEEPEPEPEQVSDPILASSPEATVLLQRSSLREAMTPSAPVPAMPEPEPERPMAPPTPIRPVPPPAPPAPPAHSADDSAPAVAATPEVRPPSDVQGPGWAFGGAARQPVVTDDPLHEEARRLARLLVSEIKLYNEEQVEEGRRKRDLYERLREDIDRSRQMYEERVEARILKTTDYFYQELVRILAAGDTKALGI
ncbi:MAG TPA: GAF domain-containing protein [Thermoanaerobaculia bacterium]|nr:GAF domain-containing protein [Thermoanaerobaculia bacterium]